MRQGGSSASRLDDSKCEGFDVRVMVAINLLLDKVVARRLMHSQGIFWFGRVFDHRMLTNTYELQQPTAFSLRFVIAGNFEANKCFNSTIERMNCVMLSTWLHISGS